MLLTVVGIAATQHVASAAMFTQEVFATGAGVGATGPDSLAFGSGSLWAAYTKGADSGGASGSSLVVRYFLPG